MKYVYLLESISSPGKHYIGITSNLDARFKDHNAGKSPHTARFKPWKISFVIRFNDDHRAPAMRLQNDISGSSFLQSAEFDHAALFCFLFLNSPVLGNSMDNPQQFVIIVFHESELYH